MKAFFDWLISLFKKKEEAASAPEVKPEPQKVYRADWAKQEWTNACSKALDDLGQELLKYAPNDGGEWGFFTADKKQFYIALISSMARYESNFKPETTYVENFDDRSGKHVVSRGLLQISIESANGNYNAGLKNEMELHDAETNLRVAVRILNKLIPKHGFIASFVNGKHLGASAYWSVVRPGDKHYKAKIQKRVKELCGG